MQLDQYRIAIRERNYIDILDLALQVVRAHAGPLAVALVVGILPAMLLAGWLLQGRTAPDPELMMPVGYVFWMPLLVLWLAPVATAPATLLLGQLLFSQRPQPGRIAVEFLRSLPQLIWYQVILRGLLLAMFITAVIPLAVWSYMNEVILLERNPFAGRQPNGMTTQRRVSALHSGFTGDLFVRAIGGSFAAGVLVASLWFSMIVAAKLLVGASEVDDYWYTVFYPLALWIVASFFCVVRFLGYLDLRIRREGWEVELLMRAEGARLTRRLT